jgi:nanoRNase/pAp phosphatase (c-di-AMP/oligoRNAs hydrolase)
MVELLNESSSKKALELIENAKHIAIVPSKVAGADAFSAAVGLYHMLCAKEKDVTLIYPGKIPDVCAGIIEKEQTTTDIFSRELMVTIDYSETPAAKVHYSTEADVLTLKVSPVNKHFDLSRVKSSIIGFDFDVVFTIGVLEAHDLGQTYIELQEEFRNAKVINIDNTDKNLKYGFINVIDSTADSLSMVIYKSAVQWGLVPNTKAAKALLTGMTYKNQRVDNGDYQRVDN